jgi:glycosyltransferase involved in cell wall biosynthesis/uncharacterized membrane protein YbhN (UPF0104 family)
MRSAWSRGLVQTGLGGVLLVLWLRLVPAGQTWSHLGPVRWTPLLGLAALTVLGAVLRAQRWTLIARPVTRLSLAGAFWLNAAGGLLNFVLPVRAGDVARVAWVSRREGTAAGAALAGVLVDKAWDLVAVVAALAAAAAVVAATGGSSALLTTGAVAAAGTGALLLGLVLIAAVWLAPRMRGAGVLAREALAFRAAVGSTGHVPLLAALSIGALLADALGFALLFPALGLHVPLPAAVAAYAGLALAFAAPAAPGYVGTMEVAGTLVLAGGLGLPAAAAAGATLLWHAATAVVILALGVAGLVVLAHRRQPAAAGATPRIAVLHCGFTYSGGGERIVIEEVLGLRRLGHRVDCFAPIVEPEACYPDLLPAVAPRTFLPQLPRWFPLRGAVQMVAASVLVPLFAWRLRYDVILAANQPSAWIAWWAGRLTGCPYVVYLNQPNRLVHPRAIDEETGWQNRPDYLALNAVIRRLRGCVRRADDASVRGADTVLVNGGYIGGVITGVYGREVVDCPAGCHVRAGFPLPLADRFCGETSVNGRHVRRPYVLLTNRHEPQKRFDLAIRAMAVVAERHPGVSLVVPGPATAHTPELWRLASELGLAEHVIFCGTISDERLRRLYEEAAVYVYPAPEEDFGMGVIEAMACGIPVVAWNQAGPTVTVEPGCTGHLARPGDVGDYAAAILAYLDSPELNERTGREGHRRAGCFDWTCHVTRLERALLEACP